MQGYIHNPPFGTRVPTMQNLPLPPPPSSFTFIPAQFLILIHSFIRYSLLSFLISRPHSSFHFLWLCSVSRLCNFLFYPFFSFSSLFVFSLLSALSSLTLIPLPSFSIAPFSFFFFSLDFFFSLPTFITFSFFLLSFPSLPSPLLPP